MNSPNLALKKGRDLAGHNVSHLRATRNEHMAYSYKIPCLTSLKPRLAKDGNVGIRSFSVGISLAREESKSPGKGYSETTGSSKNDKFKARASQAEAPIE